ncbi:MAG TPA: hypothetical protein DCO77_04840 [Nitrospiraceae bacterium]|nr:hypothetical protein [Nitrospiraceae bacterium]
MKRQHSKEHIRPGYLLVMLGLFLLVGCDAGNSFKIPRKTSQLNGWQGITIKYGTTCPDCCDLVFPGDFGHADKKKLQVIIKLVRSGTKIDDVDCMRPVQYYALRHLLQLAVVKQDAGAALSLLSPSAHGGFNLDGEVAEEYAGEYQLRVLEKFKDLRPLLNVKLEEELSDSICSWLEVLGEKSDRIRVKRVISRLQSEGFSQFAALFSKRCKGLFN